MNAQILMATDGKLRADGKGLLAMDESNPRCNQRFAKLGIPQTEEARRAYHEVKLTDRQPEEAQDLQQPALVRWHGEAANVVAAQQAPLHRARCNRAARRGEYSAAMEKI